MGAAVGAAAGAVRAAARAPGRVRRRRRARDGQGRRRSATRPPATSAAPRRPPPAGTVADRAGAGGRARRRRARRRADRARASPPRPRRARRAHAGGRDPPERRPASRRQASAGGPDRSLACDRCGGRGGRRRAARRRGDDAARGRRPLADGRRADGRRDGDPGRSSDGRDDRGRRRPAERDRARGAATCWSPAQRAVADPHRRRAPGTSAATTRGSGADINAMVAFGAAASGWRCGERPARSCGSTRGPASARQRLRSPDRPRAARGRRHRAVGRDRAARTATGQVLRYDLRGHAAARRSPSTRASAGWSPAATRSGSSRTRTNKLARLRARRDAVLTDWASLPSRGRRRCATARLRCGSRSTTEDAIARVGRRRRQPAHRRGRAQPGAGAWSPGGHLFVSSRNDQHGGRARPEDAARPSASRSTVGFNPYALVGRRALGVGHRARRQHAHADRLSLSSVSACARARRASAFCGRPASSKSSKSADSVPLTVSTRDHAARRRSRGWRRARRAPARAAGGRAPRAAAAGPA